MADIYTSANGWVETLINSALVNIQADQTILCTITDDSAANDGKYIVSYNSITFQAFTDNEIKYKNNDNVYVLIPKGDYNEQKIILCKKR